MITVACIHLGSNFQGKARQTCTQQAEATKATQATKAAKATKQDPQKLSKKQK